MSLFGNLLTTYAMIQGASGQTPHSAKKDGDADAAKKALIPYGHTTLPVSLSVLLDANGCIRGVAKIKSTIIIPCTEESMGRTIKPVPHPLFDQLQYVDSERSPEKTSMYLQQLAKWKGDDAKLEAVFKCVSEHSISEAAAHYGVELTDKDDKAGVRFEVQIGLEDSDLSNDVDIPIAIDDVQITKSVNSETTDSGKKSSDTMGMKYRVSGRAVYVTYGSISPQLAERTGFSAEDAEKIKEALVTLFENDESSARPSGSMEVLDVVWFAHNCKGGAVFFGQSSSFRFR